MPAHRSPDPAAALRARLAALGPQQLAELLRLRPDLVAARSLEDLAALASTRGSQHEAALRLDRAQLDALERMILRGPGAAASGPGFRGLLDRVLVLPSAGEAEAEAEDAATEDPPASTGWVLAPGAAQMLGRFPGGWGRPAAVLLAASPPPIPGAVTPGRPIELSALPAPAREVLERFRSRPVGSLRRSDRAPDPQAPADRPVDWLLARGLLAAVDSRHVEAPREVGMALRPDPWAEHPQERPPLPGRAVSARRRDNASNAAIEQLVRTLRELRAELSGRPLAVLRGGGIGVRERRRLASALGLEIRGSDRLLGIAQLAGLIMPGDDDETWVASPGPFESLEIPAAHGHVLACWWDSDLVPSAVGGARADGSIIAPLAEAPAVEAAQLLRETVLRALLTARAADSEDDRAPTAPSPEDLAETAAWLRPRLAAGLRRHTAGLLEEAADLGLSGAGAPTDLVELLLASGPAAVTAAVSERIADPVETVILQSDLTASARGTLTPAAQADLLRVAEPEGRGAAAGFRLTPASLHRALDSGLDRAGLEALLAARSEGPVPQAVLEAVREADRTHGGLRLLRAEEVITGRADLVEAMASSSSLKGLETVRVSPEVLILRRPKAAPGRATSPVEAAALKAAEAVGVQPAREAAPAVARRTAVIEDPEELALLFPVPLPRQPRLRPAELTAALERLCAQDPRGAQHHG